MTIVPEAVMPNCSAIGIPMFSWFSVEPESRCQSPFFGRSTSTCR